MISTSNLVLRHPAAQTGVHHTTIKRFQRQEFKHFQYRLPMFKQIIASDKLDCISFAQYGGYETRDDSEFLKQMDFSNESKFSLSKIVTKQNIRIWGLELLQQVYQRPPSSPSIMVCSPLSKNGEIGPYFFKNQNVTGETYENLLRSYAFPILWDYLETWFFNWMVRHVIILL